LRPSDALLWYVRASLHLTHGDANAAIADFKKGGEPPATMEFAYTYACALLLAGGEQGYGRYVSSQAETHTDAIEPFTLYVLSRMAMLAEHPPVPPGLILDWTSRAVKAEPRVAWYAHAQGMAAFRAGDMAMARSAIEESERLPWGDSGLLNQVALSLFDLCEGRTLSARARLERASRVLDSPPLVRSIAGRVHLFDWLEFQILRRQIEEPLFDSLFPADPFAHPTLEARPAP
jgi:hypothetical protein